MAFKPISKGYLFLNFKTHKMDASKHIIFNGKKFPFIPILMLETDNIHLPITTNYYCLDDIVVNNHYFISENNI